jgi:hypothetical protein
MLIAAGSAHAAGIVRCEDAAGRVSYQQDACPAGTRAAGDVAPAPPADPAAAARRRAQTERDLARAQASAEQRRAAEAEARRRSRAELEAQCIALRYEIQSTNRMRAFLESRPYYSIDDRDSMIAYAAQLERDWRRLCSTSR